MPPPLTLQPLDIRARDASTMFLPGDRLNAIRREAHNTGLAEGLRQAEAKTSAVYATAAQQIARKIESISFTHFEARKAVLDTLEPLIIGMVETVLPGVAKEGLGDIVAAQIQSIATLLTDGPIRLACNANDVPALTEILAEMPAGPIKTLIYPSPDCEQGEIRLTSPQGEKHIDLDRALQGIGESVAAFYQLLTEERKNA